MDLLWASWFSHHLAGLTSLNVRFSSGQVKFGVTRPDRLVSVNSLSYSICEDEGLLCSFVIFLNLWFMLSLYQTGWLAIKLPACNVSFDLLTALHFYQWRLVLNLVWVNVHLCNDALFKVQYKTIFFLKCILYRTSCFCGGVNLLILENSISYSKAYGLFYG